MVDRLYSTRKAGDLLGGLSAKDVCELIRQGKLKARRRVVRGRGGLPRYVVCESDLNDYIASLPPAVDDQSKPARRRHRQGVLSDVIEFV